MLKAVENLIRDYNNGRKKAAYGNHSMEVHGEKVFYYYYITAVCIYNSKTDKVEYHNGGWHSSSTTRTINSYKSYYGDAPVKDWK